MARIPLALMLTVPILVGGLLAVAVLTGRAPSERAEVAALAPRPGLPSAEETEKLVAGLQKEWDTHGRGLLKSFEARAYDPVRDGGLERAEGSIAVRIEGKESRYGFVFDSAKPRGEQVVVTEAVSEERLPEAATQQVKAWAIQAVLGAYHGVAYYQPPILLKIYPSKDPRYRVVSAEPFEQEHNVSYSFDDRDLIAMRGEWVSGKTDAVWRKVTNYDWEFWHGRYLLRRAAVFEGPTTGYEYAERDGVHLLDKARLRDGDRVFDAVFSYSSTRLRPR